ncbi:TIM-barrel domain-containing protein [Streptomyces sp. NPDC002896]|uniref:glycoside hydrolase family 31 protein n=1 Tax=Streptomyces sp. NPDC002896 TaxID=3154438 RepID=UPI003325411F
MAETKGSKKAMGTGDRPVRWERTADGVRLTCRGLSLRAVWEGPGILRVAARPASDGAPVLADGPMLDPRRERRPGPFTLDEKPDELVMSDGALALAVDLATGRLSYRDPAGKPLFSEVEADAIRMELRTPGTSNGSTSGSTSGSTPGSAPGYRAGLGLRLTDGEALYGLGQHEEGRLDRRGTTQYLYQHNLKVSIPFLASPRGWGLLWHGYSAMTFQDDAAGCRLQAACVPELDYFVLAGPGLHDVVRRYRQVTGAAPMPPRWAFGYLQSKERYHDQEELLAVARRYAELGLPLEGIVLDWMSWPDGLWGQKSLDPARFPDPDDLCRRLHAMGTRLMVSIWPHHHGDGPDQRELAAADALLANGTTYDAFDAKARALYWKQAETALFAKGIDAWWTDCSEPFEADWNGATEPSPEERMRINTTEAERYLGAARSNAYSLLHSRGIWEGQRATGSPKRVLNLTRSAYAGQQRYATFSWSGDTNATWETLRRQVAEGLSFAASGLPYWTTDVGAFFPGRVIPGMDAAWFLRGDFDTGAEDPGYRELFLRWFQYATFLPMLRPHGTGTPREIWHYGEPGDPVYETLVRFIRLRKRLVPYLYSLAAQVTSENGTMFRPLAFDFGDAPEVTAADDQFMLGPALMVCPVTRPQRYGPDAVPVRDAPRSRGVLLPSATDGTDGTDWVDVWDGARHAGGRRIEAPTPLERLPAYARAGSVLPLARPDSGPEDLDILVFPGADGSFELYEDEGDGWGYEQGASTRTALRWNEATGTLTVGRPAGDYPGRPARRALRARLVEPGRGWADSSAPWVTAEQQGQELRIPLRQSRP